MAETKNQLAEVFGRFRELAASGILLSAKPIELLGRSDGIAQIQPDRPESQFVYLAGEGWMHQHADDVVDWIGAILEMRHTEGWKKQRKAFLRLTCQMYQEDSTRPGWLVAQSCRVKIAQRLQGADFRVESRRVPQQAGPSLSARGKPYIQAFHIRLPVADLLFAPPYGVAGPDLVLTKTALKREFMDPLSEGVRIGQLFCELQVWWTATHYGDVLALESLKSGIIPSGARLFDKETGVTEAVIVSWVKLWPNGSLMRCAFELDPDSGLTLSFRAVEQIPLGMSFRMDREEGRLVYGAVSLT